MNSKNNNKVFRFLLGKLPMYIGLAMTISIILVMTQNVIHGSLNSSDMYFSIASIAIMLFVLYLGVVMYIQESKKSKQD